MTYLFLGVIFLNPQLLFAWGRHDLLTKSSLSGNLSSIEVVAEPIEVVAPLFLKTISPQLYSWSRQYHEQFDTRYKWTIPENPDHNSQLFKKHLNPTQKFLWSLEDNIETPLNFSITSSDEVNATRTPTFGAQGLTQVGSALEILYTFVEEPDAQLDSGFNKEPFLSRLQKKMDLFYEGTAHTHTFRHYYVPSSMIPPLISARGDAPYRSALYAKLAIESFKLGHRYWGYRFLAWSIHYAQDVTQPWHTVFVPSLSFLSFSKKTMRKEIAAFHYLTEAFSDSWLTSGKLIPQLKATPLGGLWETRKQSPYFVAQLTTKAAEIAHSLSGPLSNSSRILFQDVVNGLDENLNPKNASLEFGNVIFDFSKLNFKGNGVGATEFLSKIWSDSFSLHAKRDNLLKVTQECMSLASLVSNLIVSYVLEESGEWNSPNYLGLKTSSDAKTKNVSWPLKAEHSAFSPEL